MNLMSRPETAVASPGNDRSGEQRLLLRCISWDEYVALGEVLKDRPALRMTYDRGNLEFMTTSPEHERLKKRLSRVLEALAEEFGREIATAGNMTLRREDPSVAWNPTTASGSLMRRRSARAGTGTRPATHRRT